jgi:hypothetical protein
LCRAKVVSLSNATELRIGTVKTHEIGRLPPGPKEPGPRWIEGLMSVET